MSALLAPDLIAAPVDEIEAWARRLELPPMPESYIPELSTVRDPVTDNTLRHAFDVSLKGNEVSIATVLWTREEEGADIIDPKERTIAIDGRLRLATWYAKVAVDTGHALWPPSRSALSARVGNIELPQSVASIESLMAWIDKSPLEFHEDALNRAAPSLAFSTGSRLRRKPTSSDREAAIADHCRAFAFALMGFVSAAGHDLIWHTRPESDEQIDNFGQPVMCFYARVYARSPHKEQ